VLAVLAICAAPAGLATPPAPPGPVPTPAATALRVAAAATAGELAAGAAELPERARLSLARSASAALASLLPAESLARARAWQDRLVAWQDSARSIAGAAATLHALANAAGGPLAAVDRLLDAAALLALAAIGLHVALRTRAAPQR